MAGAPMPPDFGLYGEPPSSSGRGHAPSDELAGKRGWGGNECTLNT